MNVRCIFCGASLTVDDAVAATDTPVSCPSCKGSFVVGKGGPQVEGMAPLLVEEEESRKSSPAIKNLYIPAGLAVLAFAGVVFIVISVVRLFTKPSAPPVPRASVSRSGEMKLPGKQAADEAYARGIEFYKKKDFTAAVVEFQRSLRNNPNNISAYVYLGGTYVHMKKYKEAIPYLEKGKNLPLYQKFVYQNMGISYEKMGRYKEAIPNYSSLSKLEPQSIFPYSRLGFCYTQLRDYKNAEKALEEVLKINPKDQWAKTQLAYVRTRMKKQ